MEIDTAALFREMEEGLREERRAKRDREVDDSSATDSTCDPDSDIEDPLDRGTVFYLKDGDVHICPGCSCPHAEYNQDRHLICGISGVVLGVEHAEDQMDSVNGHKPSNCPDDHAGEPVGGKWQPKKDMFGLSQQAYIYAAQVDASEQYVDKASEQKLDAPRSAAKRGALCVDEVPQEKCCGKKRARVNKRDVQDHDGYVALVNEAGKILEQLVNYDKKPVTKARNPPVGCAPLRRRLFVWRCLKRYVKECLACSATHTLDAVTTSASWRKTWPPRSAPIEAPQDSKDSVCKTNSFCANWWFRSGSQTARPVHGGG